MSRLNYVVGDPWASRNARRQPLFVGVSSQCFIADCKTFYYLLYIL